MPIFRFLSSMRRTVLPALASVALLSAGPARAVDPLVEVLFWDSMGDAVSKGVNSYFKLQKERAHWANETARLSAALENCNGCANRQQLEAELDGWKQTERDYQDIVGSVLSRGGYDANVQRFFGITNPGVGGGLRATGKRDIIDYDSLPEPDWLAGAGAFCKAVYPQAIQCNKDFQARGFRPTGACNEIDRIYSYCAKDDEIGAMDYANILNLRLAGAVIPEITSEDRYVVADYGHVAPEVAPRVANGREMAAYFAANPGRESVTFKLDRGADAGLLERAVYKRFFARDFRDFGQTCNGRDAPAGCKAMLDRRHDPSGDGYQAPVVLQCDYSVPGRNITNRFTFWLQTRAPFALGARSLSEEIAFMKPAGFCPVRYADADALSEGRLTGDRLASADYTISMADVGADPEASLALEARPEEVIGNIRGYGAEVMEAGFAPPSDANADSSGEQEGASGGRSDVRLLGLGAAPAPAGPGQSAMDLLGLRSGMTRPEVDAIMATEMPSPKAVADRVVPPSSKDALFRFATRYREDTGRDIVVYFDGPGPAAKAIGVIVALPLPSRETEKALVLFDAARAKFAEWVNTDFPSPELIMTGDRRAWRHCGVKLEAGSPVRLYQDAELNFRVGTGFENPEIGDFEDRFNASLVEDVVACEPALMMLKGKKFIVVGFADMPAVYAAYVAAVPQ